MTVAVVTGNAQLALLPGTVAIPPDATPLPGAPVVDVTRIATVDRSTIEEPIGALRDWLMALVDDGLARALALRSR